MRSLHIFFNNTIDITLPSPNKARDTLMLSNSTLKHPNTSQMFGAFCSITGGQRDIFWFPKFDKKQPFNNTPDFIEWITDLQNSIQCHFY